MRTPTRLRRLAVVLTASLGLLAGGSTVGATASDGHRGDGSKHKETYYVSLGDSLAAGYQPDVKQNTDQSYTDKLYQRLKKKDSHLAHIKLGCSGERSATMIDGGICAYTDHAGRTVPQLAKAVDFIRQHRDQVRFVTINIGANDVNPCAAGGALDITCALKNIGTLRGNLPQITSALDRAAGHRTGLAGMTYYNPYLAAWLTGAQGQHVAVESSTLQALLNETLTSDFRHHGFAVADVSKAFSSLAFTTEADLPNGLGKAPLNVARVCTWTWMCTQFRDIHANPTGHQVIADTFAAALRR